MKTRAWLALGAACITLALSSCTTYYDIYFVPAPIELRIGDDLQPPAIARVLVSAQGVRRPDAEHDQPARFELRMHLENLAEAPLKLEPESFELLSADLQSCGTPQVVQNVDRALAKGEALDVDIFVPLPAGKTVDNYDLRGLNLKWAVQFGDRRLITGVSFQRYVPLPYYGYYDPFYPSSHWGCGAHIGVCAFRAY